MLSSAKHKINHSDFSVSSSSSSLPHSYSQAKNMTQVTMEEVWKDINLASLHQHRQLNIDHEPMLSNQNPNNSIFKDFLNKPLNQEPQPLPPSSSSSTLHRSLLPPPPPETVLSLNPHSINTHFDESARFGCFGKKRGGQESDESRGDRRHKRMIKNRESAARSRARKQECLSPYFSPPYQLHAYTNELELAISHLQKENARLKRQEEQLKMAEATQHQTKRKLQRSWTTPF
ncbi:hypothetical protein IGI04_025785 [Brassica rapa subsp. trilocularis]|uniref:BZIP domain-containing protein n=4 Tax=Brassica TaxID=3705 RepID=A0A3P6BCR9_BRACM|nr:hypothetical protein IGI04_025785 [Brassica rapa subsp. trilocularis]KAH0917185.1 hypothetical protein HID58_024845 [Brassica napus]CAF2157341.1 unnamed protein product [Brassica napus]CAG7900729.1 unnamed protein product [Brassica rapa]VDC95640.1 unnamed protein product [Brassica rapa]